MTKQLVLAAVAAALAAPAAAQPVIDGTLDAAFYGSPISVQTTRTAFGDNANPDPITNGNGLGSGSEINAVYANVANDRLYVFIAGNLEGGNLGEGDNNFNKLQVFLDTETGGSNSIVGDELPVALDGFCCGESNPANIGTGGALQRMDGLTFDSAFEADHMFVFTHGGENVNGDAGAVDFWAMSAHYADLNVDPNNPGVAQALGMQLAPRGAPRVLRGPGDYNNDGSVDAADYTIYRDSLTQVVAPGQGADGNANGVIDAGDLTAWSDGYGRDNSVGGFAFKPFTTDGVGNTDALIGPTLNNLGQGELIDRSYALGDGGCLDDSGAGCSAIELQFVLDVAPDDTASNTENHRNMENTLDIELGFDNSNTAGVIGGPVFNGIEDVWDVGVDVPVEVAAEDPTAVTTGVEFSVPLANIGNPGAGDTIELMAFVNGGDSKFLSNQITGAGQAGFDLDNRGNLGNVDFYTDEVFGDPALFTFNDIAGDQFVTFTIPGGAAVPEPTAVLLAGLAVAGFAARRRG